MRRLTAVLSLVTVVGCGTSAPPQNTSKDVTIKIIKVPDLLKFLDDQKGKIVVLDLWAEY